jgi:hypothetical protein
MYKLLSKDSLSGGWYWIIKNGIDTGWTIFEDVTNRFRIIPPEPSPYNDMEYLLQSFDTPELVLEYYINNLVKYEHCTERQNL